jgi:hypothetical protein
MTCYDMCSRCGGPFYVEDLNYHEDIKPESDWYNEEADEVRLCHCCTLDLGLTYHPWVDPLQLAMKRYEVKARPVRMV